MTFEQWAEEYFGKNVTYPEACRDAWNAATSTEDMRDRDRKQDAELIRTVGRDITALGCIVVAYTDFENIAKRRESGEL